MDKLDGIKDFIEDNKESLEKMNKEMIASYGQVPLVWLTVEEAIFAVRVLHTVWDSSCISMNQDCYNKIKEINRNLILQINKAEGK